MIPPCLILIPDLRVFVYTGIWQSPCASNNSGAIIPATGFYVPAQPTAHRWAYIWLLPPGYFQSQSKQGVYGQFTDGESHESKSNPLPYQLSSGNVQVKQGRLFPAEHSGCLFRFLLSLTAPVTLTPNSPPHLPTIAWEN